MNMLKQLKAITTMGAMAMALMASAPAFSQGTFPSASQENSSLAQQFWSPAMLVKMDKNKDGMVSRQEFMDYMGAQFDIMDTGKKGMLTKAAFTDKKMMTSTFPQSTNKGPSE
jgi:hypothetical protein